MTPSKPEANVYHSESLARGLLLIRAFSYDSPRYVSLTLRPKLGSAALPLVGSC